MTQDDVHPDVEHAVSRNLGQPFGCVGEHGPFGAIKSKSSLPLSQYPGLAMEQMTGFLGIRDYQDLQRSAPLGHNGNPAETVDDCLNFG